MRSGEESRVAGVVSKWSKAKRAQKDLGASFTSKHGKRLHGYKNHIKVDAGSKLIEGYIVSTARRHDSQLLPELVGEEDRGSKLLADKAYSGSSIAEHLARHGVENGVSRKGYRNRPLSEADEKRNKELHRVRFRIEHVFAHMKTAMDNAMGNLRCVGEERTRALIGLTNLAYNLDRAGFLLAEADS